MDLPVMFPYDALDPNAKPCTPDNPCVAEQSFVVSGQAGTKFKKYFRLTAVDKNGYESGPSDAAVGIDGMKEVWFI